MSRIVIILILLSCTLASLAVSAQQVVREPYLVRGQEVTVLFDEYEQELDQLFKYLSESLPDIDSELHEEVLASQFAKERDGYQVVPKISPVIGKPPENPSRPSPAHFNWSICERSIKDELVTLEDIHNRISERSDISNISQSEFIVELADEFITHKKTWRKIQRWIKYNEVWQGKVASGKYERWYRDRTKMIDQVILRYDLNELISIVDDQLFFNQASDIGEIGEFGSSTKRDEIEQIARAKIADINQAISIRTRFSKLRDYVKVLEVSENRTEFIVPVHTDIVDEEFLSRLVEIVESNWHAKIENHNYQIRVELVRIAPADLYGSVPLPRDGQKINVKEHAARFPDGAALTTGGKSTHSVGKVIFLGPKEVSENTLAHEFGHFLAFEDRYFRGYEDLGDDGYDLFELGTNPNDIMSHPGTGEVLPEHFTEIMDSIKRLAVTELVDQSLSYYQQGNYKKSIEAGEKALRADPVNAIAFNNICVANIKLKRLSLAISACEKSISLNPNEKLFRNNLNWARKEMEMHKQTKSETEK